MKPTFGPINVDWFVVLATGAATFKANNDNKIRNQTFDNCIPFYNFEIKQSKQSGNARYVTGNVWRKKKKQ